MGLFNRNSSITGMWLDGKPGIRSYLGDVLVWDGTVPAFVNIPRATATALAPAPAVSADVLISAVPAAVSSYASPPSLTADALVDPETAVIVTARAEDPVVRADSLILVDVITVAAQALPGIAAQSADASVVTVLASASAVAITPAVAAHFATTVPSIAVSAAAQVPVVTATGAAVVNVPVSAVNAQARVPAVSASSSVVAFAVTASASGVAPTLTVSSSVSPPKATATSLARPPVVVADNFVLQSMTKNGDQTLASTTWTEIGPWTVGSNSTVSGNALLIHGSGTATIEVGSEWSTSGTTKNWRVLKNGTVIWTKGQGTGTPLTDSFSLTVADGDLLTCEGWVNSGVSGNRIVKSGANTYLRMVP
ncbi:hypothetical protein R3Q06_11425 [Rhodococcus erythropolis]|uniref:hypothetical protein n=1 Tax=Rhodococcus erythropolis TaxID=1833 RepID=UPI00294915AC|nr:hypothetical protein [Rhodococcus erythropolis]MDV6274111.1 hypothetical protein [Rhodococcus erythropolis]